MEDVLLYLLGVLMYFIGVTVLGVSLIQLGDRGITHPLTLLGLVFGVIAGFITAITGFLYAWEHLYLIP